MTIGQKQLSPAGKKLILFREAADGIALPASPGKAINFISLCTLCLCGELFIFLIRQVETKNCECCFDPFHREHGKAGEKAKSHYERKPGQYLIEPF
jgi:hypothetical protein